MNFIQEYLVDIIASIGIVLVSIGFYKLNTIAGFIATGLMLIGVAFLMSRGGDEY